MIGMKRDTSMAAALQELAPNAQWVIRENDYEQIEWYSEDIPKPTKDAIDAKILELEASAPMDAVRDIRNFYLRESDWTQGNDIRSIRGPEWCAEWDQYRQTLRDMPDSGINPYFDNMGVLQGVEIPEKPTTT
jgi:hypothetical protein